MIVLKCANSGVDSKLADFITSYADSLAALLPLACPSAVGVLGFTSQLRVSQPSADNLFHDRAGAFGISQRAVIVPKRLCSSM